MKYKLLTWLLALSSLSATAQENRNSMHRIDRCKETYTALFGGQALTGEGTDPEFMDILQKFIFGEVFFVGDLDHRTRELITCTTLATMQTLPQLKAHAAAALRVGVSPVELREAVYQCAPFIGFPKTLNAIAAINEVFKANGITKLPTVKELAHKGSKVVFVVPDKFAGEKMAVLRAYGAEVVVTPTSVPPTI